MSCLRWDRLGDQGFLLGFASTDLALGFATDLRASPPVGVIDIVQAYTTVAIYYDLAGITSPRLEAILRNRVASVSSAVPTGVLHSIPCCYERGEDLQRISQACQLDPEEVIRLHTATIYHVFAIGFCPGFPYLGYLAQSICGVPRLATPRTRVEPGSVGLTGRQTGIYPLPRPGGWSILGRTPLTLVDVEDNYFPLATGDRVEFVRIDEQAFRQLLGERLTLGR